MVQLENILRTPSIVVTLIYFAGAIPFDAPRVFTSGYATLTIAPLNFLSAVSFIFTFAWLWALYEASVARLPPALRHGRIVLGLAVFSLIAFWPLAIAAYRWNGPPPSILLAAVDLFLVAGAASTFAFIWLAAKAFRDFEASVDGIVERPPRFAIMGLGIGIWFIHGRIQTMLAHPRLTDQSA